MGSVKALDGDGRRLEVKAIGFCFNLGVLCSVFSVMIKIFLVQITL